MVSSFLWLTCSWIYNGLHRVSGCLITQVLAHYSWLSNLINSFVSWIMELRNLSLKSQGDIYKMWVKCPLCNAHSLFIRFLLLRCQQISLCSSQTSGVATGVARGGRVPPLTAKNLLKIGKKRKKSGKIGKKSGKNRGKKEDKLGRKGKIGKFLSLCPSWQIGLATLLSQTSRRLTFNVLIVDTIKSVCPSSLFMLLSPLLIVDTSEISSYLRMHFSEWLFSRLFYNTKFAYR